jgi:hypothetical protein
MGRTDTNITTFEGVAIEGVSEETVANIPKPGQVWREFPFKRDFLSRRVFLL